MKIKTQLLGILNVTPDSCFDGGRYLGLEAALKRGIEIEKEGADWIDIGGESTRPGAKYVSEDEELERILPVIKELKNLVKIPISIDTYKPHVAKQALLAGANAINDITGLQDPEMLALAKEFAVPVCVMHMQGTPTTMQIAPSYPNGVIPELLSWFDRHIEHLLSKGIKASQIWVDPGIGFGKTADQNMEILRHLNDFKKLGFPLFLGLSRKSFMMHYIKRTREELLSATLAAACYAMQQDVDYLRVHDVGSHRDAITLLDGILS